MALERRRQCRSTLVSQIMQEHPASRDRGRRERKEALEEPTSNSPPLFGLPAPQSSFLPSRRNAYLMHHGTEHGDISIYVAARHNYLVNPRPRLPSFSQRRASCRTSIPTRDAVTLQDSRNLNRNGELIPRDRAFRRAALTHCPP